MNVTSPLSTNIFLFVFKFFSPRSAGLSSGARAQKRTNAWHPATSYLLSLHPSRERRDPDHARCPRRCRHGSSVRSLGPDYPTFCIPPSVQFLARFYPPCHSRPVAEGSTGREERCQTVGLSTDRLLCATVCFRIIDFAAVISEWEVERVCVRE